MNWSIQDISVAITLIIAVGGWFINLRKSKSDYFEQISNSHSRLTNDLFEDLKRHDERIKELEERNKMLYREIMECSADSCPLKRKRG